ncbi:hypothetical protein LG634_21325 [Streptomyces bambusae]|uniref:hypothetical protein n=1 Tax=Streptomyces bambusae TaxID=1550616 RepID=UPI001CFEDE92|nr:hypothetical protein [Streptomyces bambusae]MCB5167369.1 hypothetical protein [Streptomyces bambusae]
MAVRLQLAEAPADRVGAVLADLGPYCRGVVGPSRSRPGDGDRPDAGARTLLIVDERPPCGTAGAVYSVPLDARLHGRDRRMLHRPAEPVEELPPTGRRPAAAAAVADPEGRAHG